ncbi:MAG: zinc import ATP-binding protein ZnuC [Candidatus Poribacteria bacterium]|nr:MAG: zinc import ATP-binding protein ZnuC [Candidatus Poribacteria bacterium]
MTNTADRVLVEVRDLTVLFGDRIALEEVSLSVHAGEIVALIGPNGAGKTTLLRAILGLTRPTRGEVRRRPGLRIGYIPQRFGVHHVLPLSVERFLQLNTGATPEAIAESLREVHVEYLQRAPIQALSGGETQRVLLARTLLRRPELLVLDEPAQGVDVSYLADFYHHIAEAKRRFGCGVLLVSHDLEQVMDWADRVICLYHRLHCEGKPEEVRRHHAYRSLFPISAA